MSPTDEIRERFGSGRPFSLGVEEELFLVDPATGRQSNSSRAVVERTGPVNGSVELELHACQVELVTDVCATAGEATRALADMRRAVAATGAGLMATGTHPSASEGEAEITDKERYERIRHLLGDAAVNPVAGLHVHVGMTDARAAVRAFNGLRNHLPLLHALAANSPFRHGRDTGLASAREVSLRAWPRSGVPRALESYEDFRALSRALAAAADVPDYTWFWWKLRPHPRLGTVEVRALDVQTSLADTAAVAALTHCLARGAAERGDHVATPPELLDEGLFRAARFGTTAELPDHEGRLRPVSALLDDALAAAEPYAAELDCRRELAALPALVKRGGGAGDQRRIHALTGMDTLLRELTRQTSDEGG